MTADRSRVAFTLIELLVMIAIIAVLASLLLGAGRQVLEKSAAAKCAGNLRSLGAAILLQASDNQGSWPAVYDGKPWYTVLRENYGIGERNFLCPAAVSPALTANRISYGYNITLGGGAVNTPAKYRLPVTRKLAELIVLADGIDTGSQQYYVVNATPPRLGSRHGGKANILWGDSHITLQDKLDLTNEKFWNPKYVEP